MGPQFLLKLAADCLKTIDYWMAHETTIVTKVYPVVFGDTPDLIIVVCPGKGLESIRVKFSAGRVQLLAVVLRQLCAERVDRDDKGTAISLELFESVESIEKSRKTDSKQKSDHNQDQSLILTFITFSSNQERVSTTI